MDRFIYAVEHLNYGIGYLITILLFVILSFLSELYKKNKLFVYFFLLYLIVFSGTRSIVNADMENYKMMYENYRNLSVSEIEPSFIFLSWLFNYFTSSPYLLFFTYSFLNIMFVYLAIKNFTPYIKTSFFLFLTIPMLYILTLSSIRQSLAEAILFFAVSCLFLGKKRLFLLFGILSFFFHYSTVMAFILIIIVYFLFGNKLKIKFLYSLLIATFIVHFIGIDKKLLQIVLVAVDPILPQKYSIYSHLLLTKGHTGLKGFSIYTMILFNVFTIVVTYYGYHLIKKTYIHKNYAMLINILISGTIFVNLFGSFSDVTARIFYYFSFYYIILIPFVIYKIPKTKISKILILYSLSIFLLIWLFSGIYKQLAPNETPPLIYKNIILEGAL